MWLSERSVGWIYDAANIGLVAALAVGVVATALIVWTGNIKEEYQKRAVASLNNEAAQARLETERIKKQVAWREVSPDQLSIIRDKLHNTLIEVTISWPSGDSEASAFARSLGQALLDSGAKVSAFSPMGFLGQEPHGLSISGSEESELKSLTSALTAAGFGPVSIDVNDRKPDGTKYFTHLEVGYRTPPALDLRR